MQLSRRVRQVFAVLFLLTVGSSVHAAGGTSDTVIVTTMTFDSVGRVGVYDFPPDDGTSYQKVLMQYSLRCHGARVSTGSDRNKGCGEWDYNCETFITDSTHTAFDGLSPAKYELMSFVTPYGIGLDLGKNGTMWEFDVTDYLPILHGQRTLSVERGATQEELQIKFLFIKGTPARNVLRIEQIWPMQEVGYQQILSNMAFPPRNVYLDPAGKGFRIRSMITGHGQEGEFITRNHYITVAGKTYSWEVVKQCSDNPLYPQGGTWVYTRAGWCPGAPTELKEIELTGTVTPGDSVMMDYGVSTASGDSRYDPSNQLVTYGAPNFKLNAGITEIHRPTERIEWGRMNPACNLPVVVLQNRGAEKLTSATIEYRVDGGTVMSYDWKGSLNFLDTISVTLPVRDIAFWGKAASGKFIATVSSPNGGADEYAGDNEYTSTYQLPAMYTGPIVLNYRTNKVPEQNYYQIRDMDGQVVIEGAGFDPSTNYNDVIDLPPGCYSLTFYDDGENGIAWWAAPDDGNGYLRLRKDSKSGPIVHTFNPDFGQYTHLDFGILGVAGIKSEQTTPKWLRLYPNPTTEKLTILLHGFGYNSSQIDIIDSKGTIVRRMVGKSGDTIHTELSGLAKGSYIVRAHSGEGTLEGGFILE